MVKKNRVVIILRLIKQCFTQYFFTFYFLFIRHKNILPQKKHYISICAIFKNEAIYLKEWIEFHKQIGIDHIYMYNNFSTDFYIDVLSPYIDDEYITLHDWPHERGQISAYEHCYANFKSDTSWILYLDIDEFLCLKYDTDIKKWLKKYDKYPSVIFYWLMFGSNGYLHRDEHKLVIEQYTHSWKSERNVGKIALNTRYTPISIYHHHIFCHSKFWLFNIPMINENKKFISYPGSEKCPKYGTIQINHYWSKSLNEYIKKIDKGDVFSQHHEEIRKKMDFFYWHETQNVSENKIIWRFLIPLKIKLKNIEINFK